MPLTVTKSIEETSCPYTSNLSQLKNMCFSSETSVVELGGNLELWGVVGTWVAGLGTVAAVMLALVLAFFQEKIKLKIYSSIVLLVPSDGRKYLSVNISNVGKRSVKLTGTGWLMKHPFSFRKVFSKREVSGMTHVWDSPSTEVPAMLIEGDEAKLFKVLDKDWIEQISDNINELKANPKNLKFCVYTSYGKSVVQNASPDFIRVLEGAIASSKVKD